jgi:hypothetical protein
LSAKTPNASTTQSRAIAARSHAFIVPSIDCRARSMTFHYGGFRLGFSATTKPLRAANVA